MVQDHYDPGEYVRDHKSRPKSQKARQKARLIIIVQTRSIWELPTVNNNQCGSGTVRGNHPTLAKPAVLYMYWSKIPVHGTDSLMSPPKDDILSWFNYSILNISHMERKLRIQTIVKIRLSKDGPAMIAPPGIEPGPLTRKARIQTRTLHAKRHYSLKKSKFMLESFFFFS